VRRLEVDVGVPLAALSDRLRLVCLHPRILSHASVGTCCTMHSC
jgi:hypothetical protein